MKSKLLKSKYRILVLIEQTKPSNAALKDAVNLAKIVDAGIEIFNVKPPSQVIKQDNQIAAMRALEEERSKVKKTMQRLVSTIADEEKIPIIYSFTFGNVVSEIQKHIDKTQPDIVVIGKRKSRVINFLGDGLTSHLLKYYNGGILISGNERGPISSDNISIGFLDDIIGISKIGVAEDLKKYTDKPLKLFKIINPVNKAKKETAIPIQNEKALLSNTVTFEFDNGSDISNSISNYIKKSKVSILFVKKKKLLNLGDSVKTITSQIQKTINKTNIPVLILEK